MEGHPEIKAVNSRIEQYASLLRIRKKWASIGFVAFLIVFVISTAVLFSMAWTLRDKAVTWLTMLVVPMSFVFPYVWLVNWAAEQRRLKGVLELLDVLQRAAGESAPEDRDS